MKDFLRLAVAALDDPNGINEAAWDVIQNVKLSPEDPDSGLWALILEDIESKARSADGRYYLPEDHGIKVD